MRDLLPMRGMRICSESFLLLGIVGLIVVSFILGRGCTGSGQDIVQASDTISRVDTFMDTVYSCTVLKKADIFTSGLSSWGMCSLDS